MNTAYSSWIVVFFILFFLFACVSCGDDDDDSGDDDAVDDDDTVDDDDDDDDDNDDDDNDDNDDDDTFMPDDYVAPWPQNDTLPSGYNESVTAGPLRLKVGEYDAWHETWHQPFYGGNVHAYFKDDSYSEIVGTHGEGDSCIWTGTYLASQAMRYWITGEAQALANAIKMVNVLDGYLHVNGRPGFISRYWGPQDESLLYVDDAWCDDPTNDRCHHIESGEFAGDFWIGGTSRDQYTGWFYGMGVAYDLLDDEDTLDIIREDMTEVLDELISTNWWIIDVDGFPTDAAPNVLPPMQLSWLVTGYHVTGHERFKVELQKKIKNSYRFQLGVNSIAFFNRYSSYFGNNLAHTNWFNLLRLGRLYFSEDDYAYLLNMFENRVHTFTRLSHNPWFTSIFMAVGDYDPFKAGDPYVEQVIEDLAAFIPPPNYDYYLPAKDPSTYTLDPFSVWWHDLQVQYPILKEIFGGVNYQALEPFGVDQMCPGGFRFQWSPFLIDACGSGNVLKVHSGHEFLAAYWMASFYQGLTKDQ